MTTAALDPERTLGFIALIQINADGDDGELMRPAGLAVEKSGSVIVVDSGNNPPQVFKPDGTFVGKCGRAGNGDGEFNEPSGITLDYLCRRLEEPSGSETVSRRASS